MVTWRSLYFFLFISAVMLSPADAASSLSRGGIFSLYPRNDPLNETEELDQPYVAGLSVRFGWNDVEKSPGRYDWSLLEKAHLIAARKNKLLIIRVIAGSASPGWLYAQGVPTVTFQGSETNWMPAGATATMPVPWNEGYLQAWEKFLGAFGREITGWQNVYCVQMTGGGFIDEMHLPKKSPETIRQWNDAEIGDEKISAMWKRIIQAYNRSMPEKIGLVLDLGIPFARSESPTLIYQFALETYPGRVWFQQNGLKAERALNAKFPAMIRAASGKTTVGYQMLGSANFLDAQTGDRRAAFANAINDHSSYVEVYKADLVDPRLRSDVMFLAGGLSHNRQRQP